MSLSPSIFGPSVLNLTIIGITFSPSPRYSPFPLAQSDQKLKFVHTSHLSLPPALRPVYQGFFFFFRPLSLCRAMSIMYYNLTIPRATLLQYIYDFPSRVSVTLLLPGFARIVFIFFLLIPAAVVDHFGVFFLVYSPQTSFSSLPLRTPPL